MLRFDEKNRTYLRSHRKSICARPEVDFKCVNFFVKLVDTKFSDAKNRTYFRSHRKSICARPEVNFTRVNFLVKLGDTKCSDAKHWIFMIIIVFTKIIYISDRIRQHRY